MTVRVHRALDENDRPQAELPTGLGLEEVRAAVETALQQNGEAGLRLDVILVDDPTLADLHDQFLGDPTPTDVMAFDLRDEVSFGASAEEEGDAEGEIYVSLDRARWVMEQGASGERGPSELPASTTRDLASEVLLYAVHGALHLCGFDDHEEEERREMRRREIAVFRELGRPLDEDAHLDA